MRVLLIGASSSVGCAAEAGLREAGAEILPVCFRRSGALDLRDPASIAHFAETARTFRPDVLLIAAGICPGRALDHYDDAAIDEVFAVNTTGPLRLVRAVLPHLSRPGQVLLLSSIAARRGSHDPVYAASKAALSGFIRSMACATPGVRFNALAPGLIEGSTMWSDMLPARRAEHVQQTPAGRLVTLAEVAEVLVQLTGPAFRSLNGQVIGLDGGR